MTINIDPIGDFIKSMPFKKGIWYHLTLWTRVDEDGEVSLDDLRVYNVESKSELDKQKMTKRDAGWFVVGFVAGWILTILVLFVVSFL